MKKHIFLYLGFVAIFSFALVSGAQAGVLVDASSTPANPYGGQAGSYSVSFEVASSTEVEAQVRLIFPAGFDVSAVANATSSITASLTSAAGEVASATVSGQEITLWLADGSVAVAGDTLHFSGIPSIQSPYAGGSFTLGIEVKPLAGDEISDQASTTAFAIIPASSGSSGSGGVIGGGDTKPPSSFIDSPTNGLSIESGMNYTIRGTAVDTGGSFVQQVDISIDGGSTWLAAATTATKNVANWEYVWKNPVAGDYTVQSRATDKQGNVETPSAGVSVTVQGSTVTPGSQETTEPVGEQATVQALQTQIASLQQQVVSLLQQLVQLLTAQLSAM